MVSALDSNRCIRNAPWRAHFRIINWTTGILIPSLTGVDAEINKDSAGFNDAATAEALDTGDPGTGYVDLTATEMAATQAWLRVKASNGNADQFLIDIPFEPCLDSGVCAAGTAGGGTLPATAQAVDDIYNGCTMEIVRGTGFGQTRTVTDYTSARVFSIDRNWKTNPSTDSVYIITRAGGVKVGTDIRPGVNVETINSSSDAAANLALLYKFLHYGTVAASPAPSTTSFASTTLGTFADDYFNDMAVVFLTGTPRGLPQKISDYVGTGGVFTLSDALPDAPAAGNEFILFGRFK